MNRTACVVMLLGPVSLLIDRVASIKVTTDLEFSALMWMLLSVLFIDLDLPLLVPVGEVKLALVSVENVLLQSR